MDRREARQLLGVPDHADLDTLKHHFRILARDLHPDRGGDPAAFRDARRAFALLRDEIAVADGVTHRPHVGRGRPSRTDDGPGAGPVMDGGLDAASHEFADRLATERTLRLVSRAPGAFMNRFAASLDPAATSSLHILLPDVGVSEGSSEARIELTARMRVARRAVTGLDLSKLRSAAWSRRRGDATTLLHATPRARPHDDMPIELLTATTVVELLGLLDWPLPQWAPEPPEG